MESVLAGSGSLYLKSSPKIVSKKPGTPSTSASNSEMPETSSTSPSSSDTTDFVKKTLERTT